MVHIPYGDHLLLKHCQATLLHLIVLSTQAFLDSATYQIIGTYDQLPTIESHPELFL